MSINVSPPAFFQRELVPHKLHLLRTSTRAPLSCSLEHRHDVTGSLGDQDFSCLVGSREGREDALAVLAEPVYLAASVALLAIDLRGARSRMVSMSAPAMRRRVQNVCRSTAACALRLEDGSARIDRKPHRSLRRSQIESLQCCVAGPPPKTPDSIHGGTRRQKVGRPGSSQVVEGLRAFLPETRAFGCPARAMAETSFGPLTAVTGYRKDPIARAVEH